ncbi:hypothetical protein Trydic_g8139 [Trypoxylus dichotomus]
MFGGSTESRSAAYRWINRLKQGRTSLENDPYNGRSSKSVSERNIIAIENLLKEDRLMTISQISVRLGIGTQQAHGILHDYLGASKVSARWVLLR